MREQEPTNVGIDVLQREQFARLRGKRIGLITNATGRSQHGVATADLLHAAPDVQLTALFGPEHGIRGLVDDLVPDSVDAATGLPVYSLYGERNRPLPEQLAGLDMLLYDIQDIGTRFYTYISTLGLCLEEADRTGVPFLVLDRPNPIGGMAVQGPLADADSSSFVAHHPIPIRHGLTVGEMARLLAMEKGLRLPVEVIPVENWRQTLSNSGRSSLAVRSERTGCVDSQSFEVLKQFHRVCLIVCRTLRVISRITIDSYAARKDSDAILIQFFERAGSFSRAASAIIALIPKPFSALIPVRNNRDFGKVATHDE